MWHNERVDAARARWYREVFAPTAAPLRDLDLERVLVTHGEPILHDGRAALAAARRLCALVPPPQLAGGGELEARADAVLEERSRQPGGERVRGAPAGAVRRDQVVGREVGKRVAGRRDHLLEQRAAEMETADDSVDVVLAGQLPHVANSSSRPPTASPTCTATCGSRSTSTPRRSTRSSPTSTPARRPEAMTHTLLADSAPAATGPARLHRHPGRPPRRHAAALEGLPRYSYFNMRDYGLADKKTAIEQLAAQHPCIDIERVGIYGHSGGGFMSAAALLQSSRTTSSSRSPSPRPATTTTTSTTTPGPNATTA